MSLRMEWLAIALMALSMSGCTLCCNPYDNDYMSAGGKHRRTDMTRGRLGSVLSDPALVGTDQVLYDDPESMEYENYEEIPAMMDDEEVIEG